jgi:aminoglycoside phosphotransferase (APT) family kinase protein
MKGAKLADGRTAEVFAWGDDAVLKLARPEFDSNIFEYEAMITRAVMDSELRIPRLIEVTRVEGRPAMILERVNGKTMPNFWRDNPPRLLSLARALAELHIEIHRHRSTTLPSQRERLEREIDAAQELTPTHRSAVRGLLARLPDDSVVCHTDFHPDNVMSSPQGWVALDWIAATRGHPLGDVARSVVLMHMGEAPHTMMQYIEAAARAIFWRAYVRDYCRMAGTSAAALHPWVIVSAASRLAEKIPGESATLMRMVEHGLSTSDSARKG